MKRIFKIIGKSILITSLLIAFSANAQWTTWEYRNSDGDYRYGIKNGNDKIPLDQKNRKKADKAAKNMNKAEKEKKGFRDTNEPGCNEPGVVC